MVWRASNQWSPSNHPECSLRATEGLMVPQAPPRSVSGHLVYKDRTATNRRSVIRKTYRDCLKDPSQRLVSQIKKFSPVEFFSKCKDGFLIDQKTPRATQNIIPGPLEMIFAIEGFAPPLCRSTAALLARFPSDFGLPSARIIPFHYGRLHRVCIRFRSITSVF